MELWSSLKKDHRNLAAILDEMKGRWAMRDGIVSDLRHEAEAHFRGEAQTVYPALRAVPGFTELVERALEQHAVMLHLIDELATAGETEWEGCVAALHAILHEYIGEEEGKIIDCGRHQLPAHTVEHLKHKFIASKKAAFEDSATSPA